MNIIKERPMVFFDLETTGVNIATDRIIEISVVKVFPDGEKEVKTRLINPEMHIPEESTKIHGITDEDVKDAPTFRAISKNFLLYLENCDLGGYNVIKFDIPMLAKEFSRAGLHFDMTGRRVADAYNIFCRMEPRNLSAAYRFYCGKKMQDAHSAEADTLATVAVFEAQMERYSKADSADFPEEIQEFPKDLDGVHAFCSQFSADNIDPEGRFKWRNGEAVICFGRNTGLPIRKVAVENPDFFRWILKADFSKEVKDIAANALRGVFPSRDGVPASPAASSAPARPAGPGREQGKKSCGSSRNAERPRGEYKPKGLNNLGALDALNGLTFPDDGKDASKGAEK
ncbi:MAG: 3'-5' exonuclease [Lentisphaeria bacterium]|nr:3'-5' exonuclease [Lentisphaeria bacterium]